MDSVLALISLVGLFFLGLVAGVYGLVVPFKLLFFEIPLTRKLHKLGVIYSTANFKQRLIWAGWGVVGLTGMTANLYWGSWDFPAGALYVWLLGVIAIFLKNIGKLGASEFNIVDYIGDNWRDINLDALEYADPAFRERFLDCYYKAEDKKLANPI